MTIDESVLCDQLARWQQVLRLSDWDISVQVVHGKWRKTGDIKIDSANKLAVFLIHESCNPAVQEEIVIHELLHLKLNGLGQLIDELVVAIHGNDEEDAKRNFAYNVYMDRLESTTQDLTKALLSAGGQDHELISPYLEGEIEGELGDGSADDTERDQSG